MKRFSMAMTWLALAGLMTMISCRKPVIGFSGDGRAVTISAVTESGNGSKTAIDGRNVNWSENDQISMNGCVLELKEGAGTTEGVFEGTVTSEAPYYVGYPAEYISYDADPLSFSINIPASWTYDVAKQIVPMAAVTNSVEGGLQFHNAVNMLKLQLKGVGAEASKLKSIDLTSTTSNLSGDIEVTFSNGIPTFSAITDGTKTMTVSFGDGLQLTDEVKCVYIPLARISGGELTVHFSCANGKCMEKKVTVDANFNGVNNMLSAPELTVNATDEEQYVDLGLPSGRLWATCNVGADSPEDYGDYFAWGETETKDYYDWSNYKWGDWNTLTKYCTDSYYGTVDNKTVLDLKDDAARVNWGGAWRMPTMEEWKELRHNTYMEWVYGYAGGDVNGIVVYKAKAEKDKGLLRRELSWNPDNPNWQIVDEDWIVKPLEGNYSLSDPHLFLPTDGSQGGGGGEYGNYWSSELETYDTGSAFCAYCNPGCFTPDSYSGRCYGYPVRPVR